jgi:hypothetical protein
MEKQVRTLIEEMELLAGKLSQDQNDDNSMRTSRTLTRIGNSARVSSVRD